MSNDVKSEVKVPDFDFGSDDLQPDTLKNRYTAEIAQTRAAFQEAGYVPPEAKPVTTKPKTVEKPKPDTPAFRRRRGRPSGDRRHRISMKTTERHLEFMYAIADGRELVGAFELALEALAREVTQSGTYDGRKVDGDILKLAQALNVSATRW